MWVLEIKKNQKTEKSNVGEKRLCQKLKILKQKPMLEEKTMKISQKEKQDKVES